MLFNIINQLSNEGPLTLRVSGDCMTGSIAHGSLVQIERRAFYWPGDIVVYGRGDDHLVVHRFLGYAPGRAGWNGITQADNTRYADAPMAVVRILGKVLRVDRKPATPSAWQRLRSFAYYWPAVVCWAGRWLVRQVFLSETRLINNDK